MNSTERAVGGVESPQVADIEWVPFSGGELEGPRPVWRCAACRSGRPASATLCFQCYRTSLARERALEAAGRLDTASEARFQTQLPFEPVNRARLETLRAARGAARAAAHAGADRFASRRRLAQITARHALRHIATGLAARGLAQSERSARLQQFTSAVHAAELQLPESWLPFVVNQR